MAKAWVVVANHSHARMFEAKHRASDLRELSVLNYPEGRLKSGELVSDAPGRAFARMGYANRSMGNPSDVRQSGGEKFAREIAHALERGRQQGKYEKLYIVAEPSMVGNLREAMTPPTLARVAGESGKNLVHCDSDEIRAQLPIWL
ncbi:host attachment protein [Microbulbifer sp. 2201CG32-9]|uniref:host attachment protein n=1 Tax=unclassified Microbulbifer TaxID=2619833 RepID=UPI00345BADE7